MGKKDEKEKFEANKKSNAPFLRALKVLMDEKNINQEQVAKLIGTKSGTFSDYKNGKKRASQEMYERLSRAFGGRLNMHYLTGESQYMMLANVPDEEIAEYALREGNPDYEVQKKAKSENTPPAIPSSMERSFIIEKEVGNAKSYVDKLIASLEDQIRSKDEELASKQKIIFLLEKRIAELEAKQLSEENPLENYHFPVGVADKDDNQSTRV